MKNKAFTLLNIVGLAVGMACFILIMLWVKDELSYDRYNEHFDRIGRIKVDYSLMGEHDNAVVAPPPMAKILKNDFPEVENAVRLREFGKTEVFYKEKRFNENSLVFADSTLFEIFTIPFINGDPKTALSAPNKMVISESIAKKYFGNTDPVGEMLTIYNDMDFEITGVYKDIPKASHFHFDFIGSINSTREHDATYWISFNFATYVLLKKDVNPKDFETKLNALIDNYLVPELEQWLGASWDKIQEQGNWFKFLYQPLKDIHLKSNYTGEFGVNGDIKYVYIFVTVAIFILLLACINFTNLSTAKAINRSKEIGVKKVFGVRFHKLIANHLGESLIVVFIAHMIAMILVEVSLPFFNNIAGKSLSINYTSPQIIISLLALIIITSVIAGFYPAFYLSSQKALNAIKNEVASGKKKARFRSVMVIGQFIISIILLSFTLLLNKQMQYIQTRDLGYNQHNMLSIWNRHLGWEKVNSFKEEILNIPAVKNASLSAFLPFPSNQDNSILFKDGIKTANLTSYNLIYTDYDYFKTLDIKIIQGRGFSKDHSTDSQAVLINESAARTFGWKDPIGKVIGVPRNRDNEDMAKYTIIGVIKDYNYESIHTIIKPLVCFLEKSGTVLSVRLDHRSDITNTIKEIEKKWSEYAPGEVFDYSFYTDKLKILYQSEVKLNSILITLTVLAFLISCLGLIGLAIFATEQRKKEIGIRKVIGASISQVRKILTFDLTKLVIIAFFIAAPVSYFAMQKWLENFAYKTNISWWIFVLAGLLSYLTAMIAIGYQSHKASAANPVDTLRDE